MSELSTHDYFEIISELDFIHYELDRIKKILEHRKPVEIMVDQSSGYEQELLEGLKALSERGVELQKLLPADDPHFVKEEN